MFVNELMKTATMKEVLLFMSLSAGRADECCVHYRRGLYLQAFSHTHGTPLKMVLKPTKETLTKKVCMHNRKACALA